MTKNCLDSEKEKKLENYINDNCPFIKEFDYEISSDGSEITLSGFYLTNADIDVIFDCINDIELLLDAKQIFMTSIKNSCTCTYKFNENE